MALTKEEEAWLKDLLRLLEARGWQLAIPKGESKDKDVEGMIIGTERYIDWVLASEGERCVDMKAP